MTEFTERLKNDDSEKLLNIISTWIPLLVEKFKLSLDFDIFNSQILQAMLEWNLPILTEDLSINLSESINTQEEYAQSFLGWDVPRKMDQLSDMLTEAFMNNQESLLSLIAWDIPARFEILCTNINERMLVANQELLRSSTNEVIFMLRDCCNILCEIINMNFPQYTNSLINSIGTHIKTIEAAIGSQSENIDSSLFNYLFDMKIAMNLGMDLILEKQEEIKKVIENISIIALEIFMSLFEIFCSIVDILNVAKGIWIATLGTWSEAIIIKITLNTLDDEISDNKKESKIKEIAKTVLTIIEVIAKAVAASKGLPALAEGGIPGYGELFVAREAGPEFVGSFGSRNVVMNNDQIVAAVSGGVYDAVRRANAEQTQQPIYLNVEAKVRENVLFDMMETVKAERGVRLASGGVW